MAFIPDFPNEPNPRNPITSLEMHTKDGTSLHFRFDPPIQQSRMMLTLGALHARLATEFNIDLGAIGNGRGRVEDRYLPDGDTGIEFLDEVVLYDNLGQCVMHIEKQAEDRYWMVLYPSKGEDCHYYFSAIKRGLITLNKK